MSEPAIDETVPTGFSLHEELTQMTRDELIARVMTLNADRNYWHTLAEERQATLRDTLAAHALQGMLAAGKIVGGRVGAYYLADQTLKERNEGRDRW